MNLDIYTEEMAKSVWDKAFFMDKIPGAKCVIDFGCADGTMIRMLGKLFPETTFYGYDNNDILIDMAWHAHTSDLTNIHYFRESQLEDMLITAKTNFKSNEICLNFSSVLHEIFSSSTNGQKVIQHIVNVLEPKFITIRDMYFPEEQDNYISQIFKVYMLNKCDQKYIDQFVEKFGRIDHTKKLIHFLMKYQWKDNGYDQELEEDYFSWTLGQFLNLFKPFYLEYRPIYENHYMLPYYYEQWRDLIESQIYTHVQFILRRND
jgi:hypothetical protein